MIPNTLIADYLKIIYVTGLLVNNTNFYIKCKKKTLTRPLAATLIRHIVNAAVIKRKCHHYIAITKVAPYRDKHGSFSSIA